METNIAVEQNTAAKAASGGRRGGLAKVIIAAIVLVVLFVLGDDPAQLHLLFSLEGEERLPAPEVSLRARHRPA